MYVHAYVYVCLYIVVFIVIFCRFFYYFIHACIIQKRNIVIICVHQFELTRNVLYQAEIKRLLYVILFQLTFITNLVMKVMHFFMVLVLVSYNNQDVVLVLVSYNNQDVPTFPSVKIYSYIYIYI